MTLPEWLRQPIVLTRRIVLAFGLMLGLLAVAAFIFASYAIDDVRDDRRTNREIADVARRIFRIEQPTNRQLQRRVMRALEICARDPRCLKSLDRTVGEASDLVSAGPPVRPVRDTPSPRDDVNRPPTRPPSRPRPPGRPPRPPGTPGRPPGVPPSPPPPEPRPPVDLRIPPVGPVEIPPVCTNLIRVNC